MRVATCRMARASLHLPLSNREGVKDQSTTADAPIQGMQPSPARMTYLPAHLFTLPMTFAATLRFRGPIVALFATFWILISVPGAAAMPPANGLSASEAADAAEVLDAAADRGVGDLPASPFLRTTPCGAASAVVVVRGRANRAALITLRRLQAARGDVRAAIRRAAAARIQLRAAIARRARVCTPATSNTATDADDATTLTGTVTTERPVRAISGTGMVVALPIDFSDVPGRRGSNTPARYEQLLFGEYPHGGGSLARYYRDMSYGSFDVDGTVAPWRRMPRTRDAYSGTSGGMGSYPNNSQSLLEDAVRANDAAIDFADYDNDGPDGRPDSGDDDGYVDSVFLVYAGTSAAESGNLDATLWPHAWRHVVATRDRSANGSFIKVGRYAAVPERMEQAGPDGDLLTVGILAHEYGHVLGLPDLVDGERGDGPGDWDVMGSGVWGFEHSSRPSGMSAWSRARLGWMTPQLLEGDHLAHRMQSSYDRRTVVKLPIADTPLHEHFLVERRTRTGFDADAPGDGLLVWHVDDSISPGDASAHPRVELVAADGRGNGDVGDLLGDGGSMNDATSPGTRAHDRGASLVAIQNVAGENVDVHAGKASLAPAIDAAIDAAGPQAAAPTATLTDPVAGARVRGTITMSCTGNGSPNVNRITFYRDSTTALSNIAVTPTAPTSTQTYAFNTTTRPDGPNTLACRARNTLNQWSAYSNAAVVIDNAIPATPTISAPAAGAWLRGTVSFTATGTDNYGVTRMSHRVDGVDTWQGPWAEVTPSTNTRSWDTTTATNGSHDLTVLTEDLAGNQSAVSATRTVNVDNALPTVPVPSDGSVPPDIDQQVSTTNLSANWTAGADAHSGIASYAWRFCTSPACTTVVASGSGAGLTAAAGSLSLADGMYYTCVQPTDVAGNQGVEQCSDGVLVDSQVPVMSTPFDGAIAPDVDFQASTMTLDANWASATDGGTGVASYDWQFCTSVACTTILASGSGPGLTATTGPLGLVDATLYYACVRAVDQVSNASAFSCSDGVTVDATAPVSSTPLDGATAPDIDFQSSTTVLDATWTAATETGSGLATYDWRFCTSIACTTVIASGSGASLAANATGLTLTAGTTYFACVQATDNVGRQSTEGCSDGVTVDTGPPVMSAPTDGIPAPDIDFQTSTASLSASWVTATDGGSGIAGYDWRFCTSAACTTVLATGTTAGLTATDNALTLGEGATYYACVRATDVAGNQSVYSCSDGVMVDSVAPSTPLPLDGTGADTDSQLSTSTLDANWPASADAGGSGVASYDWRFCTSVACGSIVASGSGVGTSAAATGLTLTVGSTYYACVRAIDVAANASGWGCSDGIIVDSAPIVTITAPANGDGVSGTVAVGATATDVIGIVQFEWRLDGVLQQTNGPLAAMSPRSSTWNWNTASASEGSHTVVVTAYDSDGLTDTDTITVFVDRTAPTLTHAGITSGSRVSGSINLTSSTTDPGGIDRIDYWIDAITRATAAAAGATTFNDPGTPFDTTTLPDGNHSYIAVSYDEAGNQGFSGTPETAFVVNNNVEGVPPTGTVTTPANGATLLALNQPLTVSMSDNNVITRVDWLLDGSPITNQYSILPAGFSSGSRTKTWSSTGSVSSGGHTISATITDASGNTFTTPTVNVTKP